MAGRLPKPVGALIDFAKKLAVRAAHQSKTAQKHVFMNKIVGFLLLFMVTASGLFGQTDLRFGFQASPSFQWMRSSTPKTIDGNGSNTAFKLGATMEKYFRQNYAFTSGLGFAFNSGGTLNYRESGTWLKGSIPDTLVQGADIHYRLNYVEIPFGLKMRGGSGEDSYLNFFAELPMLTLGFRTKALADVRGTNSQNQEDIDIKETSKALNMSWGLGGGVEYNISSSTALVGGIYYQQGFFDVTKDGGDDSKNIIHGLTLRIGVLF